MPEPVDMMIPLLREIRTKVGGVDEKVDDLTKRVASLAEGQVSIRAELRTIREDAHTTRNSLHEIAIAIDGHGARLDKIEGHLGLHAQKH